MAYTLKSNPTMASASLVWCASEGLINLVNAASVTQIGTLTSATVNGRATLGSPTQGNCLSASVGAIASSTDFAVLIVQAYGKDIASDTGNMVNTPLAQMNIQSPGYGQQISLNTPYFGGNTVVAVLPSDTFSAQKSPVLIFGRNVSSNRYKAIVDNGTPSQSAADGSNNAAAVSAGNWLFCGSLPTGATAYQKTALFAVFIGITPDALASYIGAGNDPFAAMFDGTPTGGIPAGPTIISQPSNATVTSPTAATFAVTANATGGGTLSYQWQRDATNISGATSASFVTNATTVTGGTDNNGNTYRCIVTETGGSNAGSTTSNSGTLTVNASSGGVKTGIFFFYRRGNFNV